MFFLSVDSTWQQIFAMEANFDRTAAEQAFQESLDRLKSELLSASMADETVPEMSPETSPETSQEMLPEISQELSHKLPPKMSQEVLASGLHPDLIEVSEAIEPEAESWEAAIQDIEQFFNSDSSFS